MQKWTPKLQKAERFLKKAHEHGRKVYQRYRDCREDDISGLGKKVNLFYSNVNTLKESLFNSMPKPDVSRVQRGDFEDDPSRVAALVVQRGLTYEMGCAVDFNEAVTSAIIDRLVPGLGQVWVTFDGDKDEDGNIIPGSEKIGVEAVYWEDFLYEPCRVWSKCSWVARKLHLTRAEMVEAYGEEKVDQLGGGGEDGDQLTPDEVNKSKFCVYEVWDKKNKKVYHVYKGADEALKEMDDPYQLRGFFPCPRPLIANVDTTGFLPVTDYHLAQDQYVQLDTLYCRIDLIVKAIKVAGLYDASNASIPRMLQSGENELIPVDNWAMHAEKGGSRGQIDWFPVEQIATVLRELYAAFESTKSMLFEITGMSDIVRGSSSPYETKGAQEIKAQFASVRLNGYQRDTAVFVRDIMRIMAEMFSQLYSDEKILRIIGNLAPRDMQMLPQAAQILRSDVLSKYKVDVQPNSLTQADWALEKEQRGEVVQTVGQMIGQVVQLTEQVPEMGMLGVQLIKFAVAGFKAGNELEGWLDQQLDAMQEAEQQKLQNPEPPQPSPEEQKAQAEMQQMQAQQQMDQQKMQMDMQMQQQKAQIDAQMQQQKLAMDQRAAEFEFMHKQRMAELEIQIRTLELNMKQAETSLKLDTQRESAKIGLESKRAADNFEPKGKEE